MCGIGGFTTNTFKANFDAVVADELKHRGPDSTGTWADPQISLVHTRLAIIAPGEGANQPMSFDKRHVVFNGEIYNYKELRSELSSLGYSFRSDSDTEVILKAFDYWGTQAFDRLNGMFAIAIYDAGSGTLVLARDPVGVKPLYYRVAGRGLLFASELRVFANAYQTPLEVDPQSLAAYLRFGYVTHNRSIFREVSKLPPGSCLVYDVETRSVLDRFTFGGAVSATKAELSSESYDSSLKHLVTQGCRRRLVADVPIGVLLSGGYDSSLVAAICAQQPTPPTSYTLGFNNPKFDESGYAKAIADELGIVNKSLHADVRDVREIVTEIPELLSEPMADSSIMPTLLVSKFVRDDVKVVLSADGGDELFGGYERYRRVIRIWRLIRWTPWRQAVFGGLSRVLSLSSNRRVMKISEALVATSPVEVLESVSSIFTKREITEMLIPSTETPQFMRPEEEGCDWKQQLLNVDLINYLPEDILVKVDRASMYVGLEAREPLLDKELVRFAKNLPFKYKINGCGSKKWILKEFVWSLMPRNLTDRPKMGFSVPMSDWLHGDLRPLVEELLHPTLIESQGFFRTKWINSFVADFFDRKHDDHEKMWTLVLFQLWVRRWVARA